MLRPAELAAIRNVAESWLNQTCTITRPDGGITDDGVPDGTPVTIAAGVPCRAEPAASRGGDERMSGGGPASSAPWRVHLPHSVPRILPQDTITITSGAGVFEVVSSTSDRGVNTDVVASCTRRDAAS